MARCDRCHTTIIDWQKARAEGYLNAGPWIHVRIFRVVNGRDDLAMELKFCSPQCLAEFANLTVGTTLPT